MSYRLTQSNETRRLFPTRLENVVHKRKPTKDGQNGNDILFEDVIACADDFARFRATKIPMRVPRPKNKCDYADRKILRSWREKPIHQPPTPSPFPPGEKRLFDNLPMELLDKIFSYCYVKEKDYYSQDFVNRPDPNLSGINRTLGNLKLTCRRFNYAVQVNCAVYFYEDLTKSQWEELHKPQSEFMRILVCPDFTNLPIPRITVKERVENITKLMKAVGEGVFKVYFTNMRCCLPPSALDIYTPGLQSYDGKAEEGNNFARMGLASHNVSFFGGEISRDGLVEMIFRHQQKVKFLQNAGYKASIGFATNSAVQKMDFLENIEDFKELTPNLKLIKDKSLLPFDRLWSNNWCELRHERELNVRRKRKRGWMCACGQHKFGFYHAEHYPYCLCPCSPIVVKNNVDAAWIM